MIAKYLVGHNSYFIVLKHGTLIYMMRNKFNPRFLFFLALIIISSSCRDRENGLNCGNLQSAEEALSLMDEIRNNSLESLDEIEENIKGEWGTIGVLPGWTGFDTAAECIRLAVGEDSIKLMDENTGISSTSPYELIRTERVINGNTIIQFHLETNEEVFNNRMGMTEFSENQMYGSGQVDDGDTYFYERLD